MSVEAVNFQIRQPCSVTNYSKAQLAVTYGQVQHQLFPPLGRPSAGLQQRESRRLHHGVSSTLLMVRQYLRMLLPVPKDAVIDFDKKA
jgi:hypothetical protein